MSMASLAGSTPSMVRPRSKASDCSSRVGSPVPPGGGSTRHQRDSPGMSRGRSAAGSAHSRLCVNATGSPKLT